MIFCFVLFRAHVAQYGVSVHILEPGLFKTDVTSPEIINQKVDRAWKECPMLVKQEFGQEYYEGCMLSLFSYTIQH